MAAEIQIRNEQSEPVETSAVRRLARLVLSQEGADWVSEVSISFVDPENMRELNRGFRGQNTPTDVLAFEMDREPATDGTDLSCLGDVVLCPDVIRKQAAGYGQVYERELALALAHGMLHLLGWDHEAGEQRLLMRKRERELLDRFFGS